MAAQLIATFSSPAPRLYHYHTPKFYPRVLELGCHVEKLQSPLIVSSANKHAVTIPNVGHHRGGFGATAKNRKSIRIRRFHPCHARLLHVNTDDTTSTQP
jgi:hypothetical protein